MKLKRLLPIIGIIILIVILASLDFEKIIDIFSNINPIYSFLSFFLFVPLILLASFEWQILLKKQKIKVGFPYRLKNILIGFFYGFITPGGVGVYTRCIYLSEESRVPLPKCISNIIIFNTVEFIAVLSIGAIGAIYLSSIFPNLIYVIIITIVIVIALFLFFFKHKRSRILFKKLVQLRIFSTLKDKLEDSIATFHEDLPRFQDVLVPYGISIFHWSLRYVLMFFIAKLFSIEIPFIYFIMIMAVSEVIVSIPVSIYALGTRELSLITMFKLWDISNEQIVSFSLFWFLIIWVTPSIIGAFVTFFETKKLDDFSLNETTVKQFEKYMRKFSDLYKYLADIVKENISRKTKNPVIVDLGIGPGLLSKEISEILPDSKIIGVDPSKDMLKVASKNVKSKNFEARLGSSEQIPVTSGSADVVVSRFSLTYWSKPKESFQEIYRILKPGGKVILECLNRDFSKLKLFYIKLRMTFNLAGENVVRYHTEAYDTAYSMASVRKILKDMGFKITYVEGNNKKEWKYIVVAEKKKKS